MNKYAVRLKIFGHVQAVGYRNWLMMKAREHNLSGWVKNNNDMSVEALLEGDIYDINETIRNCYQGPGNAEVEKIITEEVPPAQLTGFVIKSESIDY